MESRNSNRRPPNMASPPRTYIQHQDPSRRAPPAPNASTRNDPEHLARVEALRRKREQIVPSSKSGQTVDISSMNDHNGRLQPAPTVPSRSRSSNRPPVPAPRSKSAHRSAPTPAVLKPRSSPKVAPVDTNQARNLKDERNTAPSPSNIYQDYADETPVDRAGQTSVRPSSSGSSNKSSRPVNAAPKSQTQSSSSSSAASMPRSRPHGRRGVTDKANPPPPVNREKEKVPFVPLSESYRNRLLDALVELSETEPTEPKRDDFLTDDGYYSWLDRIEKNGDDKRFEILLAEMVRRWDISYPLLSEDHILEEQKRVEKQAKAAAAFKTQLNLVIRLNEARNLMKDPKDRARNCFAVIQYPNASGEIMRYETKAIPNSLNPVWDQEVTLTITNLSDKITTSVFNLREKSNLFGDDVKEEFMGSFVIDVQSIVSHTVKSGFYSNWYPLTSEIADKDKNVGKDVSGEVNVEFEISGLVNEEMSADANRNIPEGLRQLKAIQHLIISHKVNVKSLFAVLVKACVLIDLCVPPGTDFYTVNVDKLEWTLSKESYMVLAEFGRVWTIGDMFNKMKVLECVFERYKEERTHARVLLAAYRIIYGKVFVKGSIWLPSYEQPILFDLFARIESHITNQIRNYKAFFPPPKKVTEKAVLHITASLKSILLLTRFIDKNPFFLENFNEQGKEREMENIDNGATPPEYVKIGITELDYKNGKFSFTEKIYGLIQSKIVANYQHLSELATPLDGAETAPGIIYKCLELAKMVLAEIEADRKIYRKAFEEELDILPISVKAYVPNLLLEVQNMARLAKKRMKTRSTMFSEVDEAPASPKTPASAQSPASPEGSDGSSRKSDDGLPKTDEEMIGMAFDLMKVLKSMQKKIESYKMDNTNLDFEIVTAFSPFIFSWLELTEERTVEWVENAINLDEFKPAGDSFNSSSVTDLFSAIFSALEFLQNTLSGWESSESHYSLFVTRFAQIAFKAIKHYCDRMENMPNKYKTEMMTNRAESRQNAQTDVATTVTSAWNWITGASAEQNQKNAKKKENKEPVDFSDPATEKFHKHLCVRLSNLEALGARLRSLYKNMHGAKMVDATERWRKRKNADKPAANDAISGIIRVRIVSAENLKAKGAFGKTSPYVVLRRPHQSSHMNLKVEVARSRVASGLNPIWTYMNPKTTKTSRRKPFPFLKEPSHYIIPVVNATELEVAVYHKNETSGGFAFMQGTEDVLLGSGTLRLSRSEILSSKNDSLNVIELSPQGKILLHVEFVAEGVSGLTRSTGADGISFGLAGSEDIDYWFLKMEAAIDSARYKLVRQIVDDLNLVISNQFGKIVNESALTPQQQEEYVSIEMADVALADLAFYLNKNLGIFSKCLPSLLTQYVIYNIWRRNILFPIVQYIDPVPYHADSVVQTGIVFTQPKVLDERQLNMLKQCLTLLTHFFHAEGDPLGIPMSMLKDCTGFVPGDSAKNASLTREFFE